MQNLSQTYVLESVLVEQARKGVSLCLPGCEADSGGEDSGESEGEDDHHPQLPELTLTLGESGPLSQSMVTFLRDMSNPSKNNSISPSSLFGQVCRKAPRFKGFQQQDSHELLRHLLDGMKAEEIKRSQAALLKVFHLPENVNPKKVDEEIKAKLKEYGREAKSTFVDSVFGGYFISTVLCEECKTPSQIFEAFLDISLPITEEKTIRPNSVWGSRKQKSVEEVSSPLLANLQGESGADKDKPSKHTTKKARRQAKKAAKKKGRKSQGDPDLVQENAIEGTDEKEELEKGGSNSSDNSTKANANSRSQSEDDMSDADIEDNLESDVSASRLPMLEVSAPGMDGVTEQSETPTLTENHLASHADSTHGSTHSEKTHISSGRTASHHVVNTDAAVENLVEDVKKLHVNGPIVNGIDIVDKAADSDRDSSMEHSGKSIKAQYRTKSELLYEARHRAMSTLAPRFQPVSHECSILSCLNQFTSAELLTGNNKFRCEICTKNKFIQQGKQGKKEVVYTNACKQLLLFCPPAVLTLHMKRFQQVGFSLRKVNRHVEFPLVMDIAPYCSALSQGVAVGQTKVLYSLYGVVEHSGRLSGGHYTAYVKVRPDLGRTKQFIQKLDVSHFKLDKLLETVEMMGSREEQEVEEGAEPSNGEMAPPPGKWYYISDSRVSEVSNESNVLRCQAYMLFYERIY